MRDFSDWLAEARAKVPWQNQLSQLNQLDSHDTARFISLLVGDEQKQAIALTLLMTYVGTPCLYYGTEVGLEGGQDPDNRRCFPWGEEQTSNWFGFTQKLIKLRRERLSLQTGAYQELFCDDEVLVYARSLGKEHTVVAVNLGNTACEITLPTWKLGLESGELKSRLDGDSTCKIDDGLVQSSLNPMSSKVLIN